MKKEMRNDIPLKKEFVMSNSKAKMDKIISSIKGYEKVSDLHNVELDIWETILAKVTKNEKDSGISAQTQLHIVATFKDERPPRRVLDFFFNSDSFFRDNNGPCSTIDIPGKKLISLDQKTIDDWRNGYYPI